MLLFGCWSGLVLNFGCHEFWAGLHQASPLHQEDQQGFSKTIPWLIEGRKEEVYICSLPGGKNPDKSERERDQTSICCFSPQTKHTKLSHTCSKMHHLTMLSHWNWLRWSRMGWGLYAKSNLLLHYFRWRLKSSKFKSSNLNFICRKIILTWGKFFA